MLYAYISWAGNLALLLLIFFRFVKNEMLRRYPVFFAYLGLALLISIACIPAALFFGIHSRRYYYFYNLLNMFIPLFQLWVLWDLHRRTIGNDKTSLWAVSSSVTLLAAMTAPVMWKVFALHGVDFFTRYHAVALSLQVGACILVYRTVCFRCDFNLGRNLKGILAGLSLMVAFQAVNFTRFLVRQETFESFSFFVPFIYFLALIVFAYMLWSYEPAFMQTRVYQSEIASLEERLQKVNEQLQQALKSLLLPR